ncbi:MAG TPA: asparaginase [Ilumatobacteraceae bacterium]|nr:asparaginase [Ilumatobacteraceae bacterium]
MPTPESFVPVAITTRSGLDESVHFGAVVGLGPSGDIEFAIGDPLAIVYPRSSNKPMQAFAMVRAGLSLPPNLLALVCASHDGTPMHTDAALSILATAGLDERSLANTPSLPLDQAAAEAVLRAGEPRTPLLMNCSGKHSGMLATCVHNGWAHDPTYLDVEHPLQLAITDAVDELCAEPHAYIGVDGCGAPAHAMSLVGLARAFRSIANGNAGGTGDEIYNAMTSYPQMVGGAARDVTTFMRHVPGLMAKDGADGVFAAALPDGRAIALKIADGGDRARPPVMVAALRALGVDTSAVAGLVEERIMGHGHQVGTVRAIAP